MRPNVLIVDDDVVDVELLRRILTRCEPPFPVDVAQDGDDAFAILQARQEAARVVVLLDLRLPNVDGFGFLQRLRSDPELWETVVFALSTSNDQRDRKRAREFGVAGYILKSTITDDPECLVNLLSAYTRAVEVPTVPRLA